MKLDIDLWRHSEYDNKSLLDLFEAYLLIGKKR